MTPHDFITKWQRANLSERSACQQHFLDLCDLLGQDKPAGVDPDGAWYCFERGVTKTDVRGQETEQVFRGGYISVRGLTCAPQSSHWRGFWQLQLFRSIDCLSGSRIPRFQTTSLSRSD